MPKRRMTAARRIQIRNWQKAGSRSKPMRAGFPITRGNVGKKQHLKNLDMNSFRQSLRTGIPRTGVKHVKYGAYRGKPFRFN